MTEDSADPQITRRSGFLQHERWEVDENAIRRRINELLAVHTSSDEDAGYQIFHGALTLLSAVHGLDGPQVQDLQQLARSKEGMYSSVRASAARGALASLLGDLDAGITGSLRRQLAGGVMADFVSASRAALDDEGDSAKNVAAVLAGAVYEDAIRRLGSELAGVTDRPKLVDVLERLKACGILRDSQFSIAQSYLSFRNNALHANWEKVERESVASVLGFVEQLLLRYFS